jgi:lipopolysaccharide/colanic/teichoic acid biosynthesis glycosyltransferase
MAPPSNSCLDTPVLSRQALAPRQPGVYLKVKALGDYLIALILCVPALPLLLLAALLVKCTSRGPIFYSQMRLGRHGKPYRIYKIRTMRHNCEKESGPTWSGKGDPRVTPVGWFLRKTHLDELPQLVNVLRGDMSLVGPRPERPEIIPTLERVIPKYRERLQVRPGVTGLAQVQLPADTDFESVRRKLLYDMYYIDNLGLWLDLRLICCTALKMFGIPFRVQRWIFWVPSARQVEPPPPPLTPEVETESVSGDEEAPSSCTDPMERTSPQAARL